MCAKSCTRVINMYCVECTALCETQVKQELRRCSILKVLDTHAWGPDPQNHGLLEASWIACLAVLDNSVFNWETLLPWTRWNAIKEDSQSHLRLGQNRENEQAWRKGWVGKAPGMFTENNGLVQEQGHSRMLGLLIETELITHSLLHEIKGQEHSVSSSIFTSHTRHAIYRWYVEMKGVTECGGCMHSGAQRAISFDLLIVLLEDPGTQGQCHKMPLSIRAGM